MSEERFIGSIAMVRRMEHDDELWLVRYHTCGGYLQLISAACLENESFREAIDRELAWSLKLQRGKDYLLSSVPRLHLEVMLKSSSGENVQAFYVEFYVADIYRDAVLRQIEQTEGLCWLSTQELRNGVTSDGILVDPMQSKLIAKGELLPYASGP